MKPTRCIDPVIKYCQECPYGYVIYLEDIENKEDLEGACFESGCTLGLENTKPTQEELNEVNLHFK